jgi:hypothetical protein
VAVVGGALFGFDISSMSAIISTKAYLCYFNQGPLYMDTDGMCSGPTASVQGTLSEYLRNDRELTIREQVVSQHPCLAVLGSVLSSLVTSLIFSEEDEQFKSAPLSGKFSYSRATASNI